MYFNDKEFNQFAANLMYYLSLPLIYEKSLYEKNLKRNYPVGRLGDIHLYFNHYVDFEEAQECWERRKRRINKDNLLIISSTMSEEVAFEFEKLPYDNKFIFTPFINDFPSNIHIDYNGDHDGVTIGMISNKTANGHLNLLNLFALLNHENNYLRLEE